MELITSRAVIGEMKRALSVGAPPAWVGAVANQFLSDQASEQYPWLTSTPALREWVGGRNAKGFTENSITIANKHFEGTLSVQKKDLRRDKFDMIRIRIAEQVRRAMAHPASMLSTLIANGATGTCYDGQYFFSTSHAQGSSGTQSNSITATLSGLPVIKGGTTTAPSVEDMQMGIGAAIQAITTFKDDAGEPMNEDASSFLVMVPPTFMQVGLQAVATPNQVAASQTALSELQRDFGISVAVNARLGAWTTKFAVFRTDSYIKPFIFQRETQYNISAKAEGSDYEHDNDAHEYGIDYWGNVAYGLWQNACLVTFA
jgi:phage major head subunit gpT-like protein